MRHPALTRFFAAFLAVISVITLISGCLCIQKAGSDREKQNTSTARLSGKTAEAKALRAELDAMPEAFERQSAAYDEAKERYDSEKLSYRKDLSIYTATEAGLKQGQEQLDEGYAALRMGWIQHDNGEKKLKEVEEKFLPGYEEYLARKAQLEEAKKQLEQGEQLLASLPDLAVVREKLTALKNAQADVDAALAALRSAAQNAPTDPESGEPDSEAQRAQLAAAFGTLSARLAVLQTKLSETPGLEQLAQTLSPGIAALSGQTAGLAAGSQSAEELAAAAGQILTAGQGISAGLSKAIAAYEQTLLMLANLPALRAQLEQGEAALKEIEPTLLKAKKGIDDGKKQLDKAKQALISAEAKLISGTKELNDKKAEQETTKEELDRRKAGMEEEAERLDALLREVEAYRDKRDRFSNLRYALLADEGIAARVRAGEDLIAGAEEELTGRAADTQREYELRFAAAVCMLAAALFGVAATAAAFRDRRSVLLLLSSALAFALAAAAEGVSWYAGRGMIYTVLFVGVAAAAVLALNLRKA